MVGLAVGGKIGSVVSVGIAVGSMVAVAGSLVTVGCSVGTAVGSGFAVGIGICVAEGTVGSSMVAERRVVGTDVSVADAVPTDVVV